MIPTVPDPYAKIVREDSRKIGIKSWKMALFSYIFPLLPINFIIKMHGSLSYLLAIEGAWCHLCKTITITKLASQIPQLWITHCLPSHPSAGPLRHLRHNTYSISPLLDSQVSQPAKYELQMKRIYLGLRIYHVTYPSCSLSKDTKRRF